MRQGQARPKGHTPAELDERLADVLCNALLLAKHHQVDLPAAIKRKWLSRVGTADTWPASAVTSHQH